MIEKFQKMALLLAKQVDPHLTNPNPRVGCVIVKNNKIIATGVHEQYGGFHAERQAILKLEKQNFTDWKNSEIFITLEPCANFKGKKTPSCTALILEKKFKKIYVLQTDILFKGQNLEKLKKAGLDVILGCSNELIDDLKTLNPFFEHFILKKKPYITLKIAQSLNGKITTNLQGRFTSKKSLQKVHEMRANYSYLLTSTRTVLADNPQFNTRLNDNNNFEISSPHLIILGKSKIPQDFNIFKIKNRKIYFFETLADFLKSTLYLKIDSIMTECGGVLNSSLLEAKIINEINYFLAPKFFGENQLNSFLNVQNLAEFKVTQISNLEDDIFLRFKI